MGGRSHSILSPKERLPKKIECTENADSIPREVKAYGQDFPIVTGSYPCFSSMKLLEVFLVPLVLMIVRSSSYVCKL